MNKKCDNVITTNFDAIKKMSFEEMSKFLSSIMQDCKSVFNCTEYKTGYCDGECKKNIVQWLSRCSDQPNVREERDIIKIGKILQSYEK